MADLEQATILVQEMLAILDADLWEHDRAVSILAKHKTIDEELYMAVWEVLKDQPKVRRAWKEYVAQALHEEQLRKWR